MVLGLYLYDILTKKYASLIYRWSILVIFVLKRKSSLGEL
jgi:hypothetical protein